jgi:hypothetical protein
MTDYEDTSAIIIVCIVSVFLLFLILMVLGGYFSYTRSNKRWWVCAIVVVLIPFLLLLVFFLILSIPMNCDDPKEHEELENKYKVIGKGTWCRVYKKGEKTVIKQMNKEGGKHVKMIRDLELPWTVFTSDKSKYLLGDSLFNKIYGYYQMKSYKRRMLFQEKNGTVGLCEIRNIDDNDARIEMELVYPIEELKEGTRNTLKHLNENLMKDNLVLTDMHLGNWMVGKEGYLKSSDGEMFTKSEYAIISAITGLIGVSPYSIHDDFSSIIRWPSDCKDLPIN